MSPDARERPAQSSSGPTGATNSPSLQNSATPIPLPLPVIPDYEVLKRIGGGSYGDVWLARSLLGTWRAVKVVYRNSFEHDKPFEREFKGIQRFEPISLMHESQVKILHVGRNDAAAYFYYVMELADDAAGNPKPETRNPHAEPAAASEPLRISSFGFPSSFDIRHSDFYTPRTLKHELQQRGRLPVQECIGIGLSLTTALAHLHESPLPMHSCTGRRPRC